VKAPSQQNGRASTLGREDRAELFDRLLERDFLGSCLIYPDLILSSGVSDADFSSTANRVVFQTLLQLTAAGEPIGTLSVRGALHDAGKLALVGGSEYLDALTDGIPSRDVSSLRLRKLARKRRVHDAAQLVAAKAGADDFEHYRALLDAALRELDAVENARASIPMLADRVHSIRQIGPRLPVALAQLEAVTRGGIPMGKFLALVGAPGANKTNFAAWLADGWERAGCAVLFMAADEAFETVITRLGQLDGFDRDNLEGEDDGRRNAFARQSRGRCLAVIDPFDDRVSLEAAERMLIEMAGTRPRVLVVDSVQTVPCESAMHLETRREQVEAKVEVIKGIAKRGAVVVAISEMARAGYRTGRTDQDISALSAGAESRAIEYAAHLLLGLKPVKGEQGLVDVEVAKNRLGIGKPEFRLSLDFESLRFREVDRPADDEADREAAKFAKLRARLLQTIAREQLATATAIVRAAGARKRDGTAVLRELIDEGVIARVDGIYRVVRAQA
jgi:replicative DNA helicase